MTMLLNVDITVTFVHVSVPRFFTYIQYSVKVKVKPAICRQFVIFNYCLENSGTDDHNLSRIVVLGFGMGP